MARKSTKARLHLLTAREVQKSSEGDRSDGGNLLLRVRGESASWVFRYTAPSGKRRDMGLGIAHRGSLPQAGDSLTSARDAAHEARELLRQGLDPLAERDSRRQAAAAAEIDRKLEKAKERLTLARAARGYHERVIEPTRTSKHAAQWISSLENHVPSDLWQAPISNITAPALLKALEGITPHERARNLTSAGGKLPETVRRIRQRLESIFEDAQFHGHVTANPAAAIRRKLREAEPGKKAKTKNAEGFRALPYKDAPALMGRLRAAEGTAARCLEFAILTAARTSEAIYATWDEIDLQACTWLVPAKRMKAGEPHLVHLSPRALELLSGQFGQDERIVFPSTMPTSDGQPRPQSNMAMLTVLTRMGMRDRTTVHGLCRATFSTWAYDTAAARPDVIEACLAHREADKVKRAYSRAQFADERAELLVKWSQFLAGAQVIEFKRGAA
jgi:integrase